MSYNLETKPSCKKAIKKAVMKKPELKKAIENKVRGILKDPNRQKNLKHSLFGERRVHIMKSFVLKYVVEENTVTLIDFSHHDDAYRR